MLVIADNVKQYFEEVETWARNQKIQRQFTEAMVRAHLYGCSWTEPEKARVILYAKDFAPYSFLYSIEFLKGGEYKRFISGGLIFSGLLDKEQKELLAISSDTGWRMHS